MHVDDALFSRLVGQIYQAASSHEHGDEMVRAITLEAGFACGAVHTEDRKNKVNSVHNLFTADGDLAKATPGDWQTTFNRQTHGLQELCDISEHKRLIEAGHTFCATDLAPLPALRRTQFHREYFQQLGADDFICTIVRSDDDYTIAVCFGAPANGRPLSNEQQHLMKMLAPHFQRAYEMRRRLDEQEMERNSAWQSLDSLATGIFILAENAQVLFQNVMGEEILESSTALSIHQGTLHCRYARSNRRIQTQIQAAIDASRQGADMCWAPTELEPPEAEGTRLILCAYPLRRASGRSHSRATPACMLFAHDLTQQPQLPRSHLAALFQLTPSEAAVALGVAHGLSIEDIAALQGHSVATCRTVLKRVFAKTDTGRQNELANLILSLGSHIGDRQ
ncbi:MAG: hypothetical protein KDI09_15765 [Halioglobus sp.]|nr:hypothetical protein [Halioglobus sp.]